MDGVSGQSAETKGFGQDAGHRAVASHLLAPNGAGNLSDLDADKLSDVVPSYSASRQESRAASEEDQISALNSEDDGQLDEDSLLVSPTKKAQRDAEAADRRKEREFKRSQVKQQNVALGQKRDDMAKAKLADSLKRFSYLLGQTELFQHFVDVKKSRDPEFAAMLAQSEQMAASNDAKSKDRERRHRKSEKEEDAELLKDQDRDEADPDDSSADSFRESPAYVKNGVMRDYQVFGLNWMISLYHNGINGILADEMGLGKTLQTISFLGYLKHFQDIRGPHLVVVPKSTLDNWAREFAKWVPTLKTLKLQGSQEERKDIIENHLLPIDFECCITTYEMCLREKAALRKISWEYIVIDEAHRIKNVDSVLSQIVRGFLSRGRLLITGTPLQNNLEELWALLNFLLPDVFSSSEDFNSWFSSQGQDQDKVIKQLHKVLRPFLLRRVKADVERSLLPKKEINIYVGMTEMQRKWYRNILEKDIDAVNGLGGKKEGKTRLLNIVMQLRKCCNHPYLFDGAEPGPPFTTDEHLVENAGKMLILDKMLKKMKAQGSRVLIFSQMSRMLDILEDYSIFREYGYCRIDGNTPHEDRIAAIDDYSKEGSDKFLFLLTTRAGGLGINLTSADIVVLYDSDWNPQVDLQAMDRAHRIGQTKQVYVFRFVTEYAVEERVQERAAQKLRLDQLVIQQGRAQQVAKQQANKDELVDMIQHGAEKIINSTEDMITGTAADDFDEIMKRGEEKTELLNSKFKDANLDDLTRFTSESTMTWEGQDYKNDRRKLIGLSWIQPAKRERKANYSVDGYYRDALKAPSAPKPSKAPRAPRQLTAADYQFFPPRLQELYEKETLAYRKAQGYRVPRREVEEGHEEDIELLEREREEEQARIDAAEPISPEEVQEKEDLEELGFKDWNRRDFQKFVSASARHGRKEIAKITEEMEGKTLQEVQDYSDTFWERYTEIADHERIIANIEAGESQIDKVNHVQSMLNAAIKRFDQPMIKFRIQYNNTRGKIYTEEEDRFLIVRLCEHGYGSDDVWEKIRRDISQSAIFRFDWFIKSRTPTEINRRCNTLVTLVVKQVEAEEAAAAAAAAASKKKKPKKTATEEEGVPTKTAQKKRPVDDLKGKSNGRASRDGTPGSSSSAKKRKK